MSVHGVDFVVDVCAEHRSQLTGFLSQLKSLVDAGHRQSKRGDLGAVRAWARVNGHKVGERGRIPGELLAAYDSATVPAANG